ncbi:UPF0182 family protein, partial [Patescibacteria group bacterium]|nr:UPF0182 family protein [Patescibacteria group bacterium]
EDRNYMRASVLITIGAWSGEARVWIKDGTDPVVNLLDRALPGLFDGKVDEMPEHLSRHIRYPDDLIRAQALILASHHMGSAESYYRQDSSWAIAQELIGNASEKMDPRYVMMDLGNGPEFVSNMFFTPSGGKMNLLGILSARCDPAQYGQLILTRFPRDEQALGPQLAEARISKDSLFSSTVLPLQTGNETSTTWGNVIGLIVSYNDTSSVVYIKSLYISTVGSKYPTLKYVIGVVGERVAFGKTLDEVLDQLYAGDAGSFAPVSVEDGQDPFEVIRDLWEAYKNCYSHECRGAYLDQLDALLAPTVDE